MSRIIVTGKRCGGFRMRGIGLAKQNGWEAREPGVAATDPKERYDAVVLVKYDEGLGGLIRKHTKVLIYDPLDSWMKAHEGYDPLEFFGNEWKRLRFDAVVATSPSAEAVMRLALPDEVKVVLSPHHADPACQRSWYDPQGPVVYAGGPKYLGESAIGRLATACRELKRVFRVDDRKDAFGIQGAAACVALRLPPHDTPLNRTCKPQVKLANALACGIPALASEHPCSRSVYPDWPLYVESFPVDSQLKAKRLVERLLETPRPAGSTPQIDDHARLIQETVDELLRAR